MVIWLTGIPGVGKRNLAEAMRPLLANGRRVQVLDARDVRRWVNPSTAPPMEEQVAGVAWIAKLLATNDIIVIVCCMAPSREQRNELRHSFFDDGVEFYEVWVDGGEVLRTLEDQLCYERPDPPDSRVLVTSTGGWDCLARQVVSEISS